MRLPKLPKDYRNPPKAAKPTEKLSVAEREAKVLAPQRKKKEKPVLSVAEREMADRVAGIFEIPVEIIAPRHRA